MTKSTKYNIIHLSDLHLTSDDDASRTEPKIFGSLKGMNDAFRKISRSAKVQEANLILVTGDITDRGEQAAWQVFWAAISSANLLERTIVIPGNHDVCCLGLRTPAKDHAKADLQKAVIGLSMGQKHHRFPWADLREPWLVIFGLNSNNLGNLNAATNAMGEIDYFQLEAFARLLRKYQNVPVKIVTLHHSPNIPEDETATRRQGPTMSYFKRLARQLPQDQRRAIRLLCITQGVRIALHGHLHRSENRRVGGVRIIGAPATTEPLSNIDPTYTFWNYSISQKSYRISYRLCAVKIQ